MIDPRSSLRTASRPFLLLGGESVAALLELVSLVRLLLKVSMDISSVPVFDSGPAWLGEPHRAADPEWADLLICSLMRRSSSCDLTLRKLRASLDEADPGLQAAVLTATGGSLRDGDSRGRCCGL